MHIGPKREVWKTGEVIFLHSIGLSEKFDLLIIWGRGLWGLRLSSGPHNLFHCTW